MPGGEHWSGPAIAGGAVATLLTINHAAINADSFLPKSASRCARDLTTQR
jgi:hypothetical protein